MIKLISWLLWPTILRNGDFDIEGQPVVAIERLGDKTNIGWMKNGEIKEYLVCCSIKCHEDMVKRFQKKRQTKST